MLEVMKYTPEELEKVRCELAAQFLDKEIIAPLGPTSLYANRPFVMRSRLSRGSEPAPEDTAPRKAFMVPHHVMEELRAAIRPYKVFALYEITVLRTTDEYPMMKWKFRYDGKTEEELND